MTAFWTVMPDVLDAASVGLGPAETTHPLCPSFSTTLPGWAQPGRIHEATELLWNAERDGSAIVARGRQVSFR
ncbi:hypothetical protein [Nonomuraea jabiensis]|uniref:hypothetical protein n=1 Tax=Nonomuraea jabiensis TaxID=882448 RepID=UPI003D744901